MFLYVRLFTFIQSIKVALDKEERCPIKDLPPEILILIFEEYCNAWSPTNNVLLPELRLTQICQYWRWIAIDHSKMWTRIVASPQTPPYVIPTYLERSRARPLDLDIDLRHEASDGTRVNNAFRWRRLNLHIGPQDATAVSSDLRELGTPVLEELRLSSGSHVSGINKLFEGGAPLLKSLRLVGTSLLCLSPSFAQITALHLTSNCPMHFSIFHHLLTTMINLQELALQTRVVEGWPLYPSPADIIHLPALESLKLSDRRWPLFIPLLSISAPILRTLLLYDLVAHDLPETFMESQLQQNHPALRNVILKGRNTYINEFGFIQLARIFPAIEYFSLLGVDSFFMRECSRILHRTTIWPNLRTISMIPVVAEDILCSLIFARTRPTSQTPLKTLVVHMPSNIKRIHWIAQKVHVEEYKDHSAPPVLSRESSLGAHHPCTTSSSDKF
ncbi:hypothetical protein M413DRAFT_442480 [Hebeloma cylindrosporum]|uniref:Uncharacterized protein n=1 Tax=Hebeloma cylindrosporum TaxID=76867 RepID=A0A0C2YU08_HEBCY|nr:hypothetical protein M413DRAFT_442480 [Hebeloma cylindrosporum h7]